MEVFVRDSKFDLRNILSNVGLSKDTKIIIEDIYFLSTKPFGQSNNTILASCSKAEVKMIDQHDLEIRADERKKVVAELWEFIKEKEHFEGLKGYWGGNVLDLTLLKQKLNELKGEKDE